MKEKSKQSHMRSALNYANDSTCERKKVGCVIVKDNRIISIGYNGTPPGWDNCCEDRHYMDVDAGAWLDPEEIEQKWPLVDEDGNRYKLVTKPEVYHAEANAIAKLARCNESGEGSSVFISCSPCIDCAKLLAQVGVKEVYFAEDYKAAISSIKGMSGTEFLEMCGIHTEQIELK
jgi:dCMP deaminase